MFYASCNLIFFDLFDLCEHRRTENFAVSFAVRNGGILNSPRFCDRRDCFVFTSCGAALKCGARANLIFTTLVFTRTGAADVKREVSPLMPVGALLLVGDEFSPANRSGCCSDCPG